MNSVPEEVWKKIFSHIEVVEDEKDHKVNHNMLTERLLRKLACVSKLWSKIIDDYVLEISLDPYLTYWTTIKHRHLLKELMLTPNSEVDLTQFTNLTSLDLFFNMYISSECVEKLTNLTELNISGNPLISTESIEKLTNLKILHLNMNFMIDASSLLKLPFLEEISICAQAKRSF